MGGRMPSVRVAGSPRNTQLIIHEPLNKIKERNFRRFMASTGDLDVLGVKYPKMQILTTSDILGGKRFITPSVVGRTVKSPVLPLG